MASHVRCSAVIIILFGFFDLSSCVHAQAAAMSKCESVIEGEIILHKGSVAQFRVRADSLLIVKEAGEEGWYGFLPLVDKIYGYKVVPFQAFISGRQQHIVQLGEASAIEPNSAREQPLNVGSFQMHIKRTSLCTNDTSGILQGILQKSHISPDPNALSVCCVTCDDDTVCGGSVSTSCGTSCNTGGGFRV